ncbi:acyltransferase [Aeromicrobium sp.]|uniref:acyltransferase family protein n=1 Tax=Aeromicrobium sp. TaxID=1871063 RepID=UPI00199FF5AA|nr:acyltransferase [Aeromicrobium sp.]MBC7630267.1 acyltransferase [Aeromicrobium sp.]
MTTARHTYPGLDSLRALAALAVLTTHVSFYSGGYSTSLVGTALARLDVGVAIFFVLSGFLLGRPYVAAAIRGGRTDSAARYLWKRALRILPVYWVSVTVALVVFAANREMPVSRWLTNLSLTDVFLSDALPSGLTQMWSLSIEAAFYLALPLLFWVGARAVRGQWTSRRLYIATALLGALNIAWVALSGSLLKPLFEATAWWLPSYFLWFALGIALAVAATTPEGSPSRISSALRAVALNPGTCWTAAGALFLVACTPLAGPVQLALLTRDQSVAKLVLYGAVAALIVLPSALGDDSNRYGKVLAAPVLRHLGHVSYCLFCCHQTILLLVADHGGFVLFGGDGLRFFAVTLLLSLLAAEALHWLVERPVQRWRTWGGDPSREIITPNDTATRT